MAKKSRTTNPFQSSAREGCASSLSPEVMKLMDDVGLGVNEVHVHAELVELAGHALFAHHDKGVGAAIEQIG